MPQWKIQDKGQRESAIAKKEKIIIIILEDRHDTERSLIFIFC